MSYLDHKAPFFLPHTFPPLKPLSDLTSLRDLTFPTINFCFIFLNPCTDLIFPISTISYLFFLRLGEVFRFGFFVQSKLEVFRWVFWGVVIKTVFRCVWGLFQWGVLFLISIFWNAKIALPKFNTCGTHVKIMQFCISSKLYYN